MLNAGRAGCSPPVFVMDFRVVNQSPASNANLYDIELPIPNPWHHVQNEKLSTHATRNTPYHCHGRSFDRRHAGRARAETSASGRARVAVQRMALSLDDH